LSKTPLPPPPPPPPAPPPKITEKPGEKLYSESKMEARRN